MRMINTKIRLETGQGRQRQVKQREPGEAHGGSVFGTHNLKGRDLVLPRMSSEIKERSHRKGTDESI